MHHFSHVFYTLVFISSGTLSKYILCPYKHYVDGIFFTIINYFISVSINVYMYFLYLFICIMYYVLCTGNNHVTKKTFSVTMLK